MSDNNLPPNRFAKLAAWGYRVIPVHARDKKPAVNWSKYMTEAPSPDEIARWDRADFNVGIVTGLPDSVVVLDVDNDEAQQFVDGLSLPITPTVRTGRGHHYYFKTPAHEIRNTVRLADQKLDVRGSGGFVVAPGSIHANGFRYEWEISPSDIDFAPFPEQITALIEAQQKAKPKRAASGITSAVGATDLAESGIERFIALELDQAVKDLNAAASGERNDTLFKVSARMARHVAGANADWTAAAATLTDAAVNAGLEDAETASTIESGWKAGAEQPTPWVRAAVDHVYLSVQNSFYHFASRTEFDKDGFNGQHGHKYHGKGKLTNFLLDEGFIRKVSDLTYDPLDLRFYIERDGLVFLNTYRPSNVTAVVGDPEPFVNFMAHLVPDENERAHLLNVIAFTVRNPGKKVRHAVLLRTKEQGVGKSMMAGIWAELLGPHNVNKTTPKQMAGEFNGYLKETLLVLCEEMNFGMGQKAYNDLKDDLTSDKVPICSPSAPMTQI